MPVRMNTGMLALTSSLQPTTRCGTDWCAHALHGKTSSVTAPWTFADGSAVQDISVT